MAVGWERWIGIMDEELGDLGLPYVLLVIWIFISGVGGAVIVGVFTELEPEKRLLRIGLSRDLSAQHS